MATFRTSAAGGDTTGTSDRTCTITPAVGDLFVVFCAVAVNANTTPTCSDDNGGTYTRIRHAFFNASASSGSCFVRDQLLTNTTSTTVTVATGSNDSGEVVVVAVSGMSKVSSAAVLQSARSVNQAAGGTPAATFAASALTSNLTLGGVSDGANPAGLSPPVNWTERQDVGQGVPNVGLEVVTRDSGFTGTTITWSATSVTAFSVIIAELDASDEGAAAITLGALTEVGAGTVAIAGSAAITLSDVAVSGTGTVAVSGALTKTLDAVTLSATGTVSDPTATTAVLLGPADSGQTQLLAGMTYAQFDGADSYAETASPADGTFRIAEWNWDFDFLNAPGVNTATGMHVAFLYATAGVKRVKLTVVADDGSTASATVDVTIAAAPSFSGHHKYIRSDGSDAHTGNSNDAAGAYLTYQKEADTWRSGLPTSSWGEANINGADSVNFDHSTDTDYGPLLVAKVGASADPIINCTSVNGDGFRLASSGHENNPDHPTFYVDVDLVFPNSVNAGLDAWNLVQFGHKWGQFIGARVVKSGILTNDSTGGGAPDGACLIGVDQSQSWRNGLFMSSTWNYVRDCTFTSNGSIGDRDNGVYVSDGADRFAFVNVTIDRGTPPGGSEITTAGMNHSGATRGWCDNLTTIDVLTAWGPGGNAEPPGEETLDLVCNSLLAKDTLSFGLYPDYCQRISVRNPRLIRGCALGAIVIQEASATQFVQGFRVLNGSFALIAGPFCFFNADTHSTGIVIENCAVTKPAGLTGDQKYFYTLPQAQNVAALTADYNVYWRVGGTPDADTTFASVQGVDKTWAQWQALGFDAHSKFRDPLFTNVATNDLTLQAGSPCLAIGLALGVITKDCAGTSRVGSSYDIGAFQQTSGGGGFEDTTPPVVAITAPLNSTEVVGTVAFTASASDDVAVVGVQLKVDGVNLGAELTVAPYTLSWDTTAVPDGLHTLTATARDAAGNSATSATITVFVNNIPDGGGGATLPSTTPSDRGPLFVGFGTGPFRPHIGVRGRLFPTIPHRRR